MKRFRILKGCPKHVCFLSWIVISTFLNFSSIYAGPIDDIVNMVSEAQYTHFHSDLLYTHNGDDRKYGAEHDLAQANIFDTFASLGLDTSLYPFPYQYDTYYNVVGVLPGLVQPEQIYIVGAHYDSVGNPGADDNASGVAAVMEAARVLSQFQFSATIVFIAFDREEQRLYGSKYYAIENQNEDIRGMVNLDMIAYNPNKKNQAWIYGRDWCDQIKLDMDTAFDLYGNGVTSTVGSEYHGNSDHHYFGTFGKQSIWIGEYDVWTNPYYHKQTDSSDTPNYIDYAYATNITKAVTGYLATEANLLGDYIIYKPDPGLPGVENTILITGGTPNESSRVVYSLRSGTGDVSGCPGVYFDIANPITAGSAIADENGQVSLISMVPQIASGKTVFIQAVDNASCTVSNLVEYTFP